MAEEVEKQSKKELEIEEKQASKLADGVAGTSVGIAKTVEEIATAPIRIVGRTIDGAIQGVKHGIENSNNPIEGATKPVIGGIVGTVKGVVKGVEASARQIGDALSEVGENITKVGKTLKNE